MKKIILVSAFLLLIPFCLRSNSIPILNNSGSSSEDTLTFTILNLWPNGNPADKLDSAYFTVFKNNANDIIFRDSSTGVSMPGIDSFVIGGDVVYYFHRAVADIDGPGVTGTYSYNFLSVHSDSSMRTPTLGQFQIVGWELDDIGDSTGLAARSATSSLDSLHLMIDSLMAVLDTLQNQDNWTAKEVSLYDPATDSVIIDGTEFAVLNGVITSSTLAGSGLNVIGQAIWDNFDSAQVASSVWNTSQTNHTIAGTFGKYLDSEVSGLSGGGGGYSYQLVVIDSGAGQIIPGVSLTVRNLDQSALIAVGMTDIFGAASFNLNAASYVAIAVSPGYMFENFDTVVVAEAGIDSVYGYQFDPGNPASPNLCRVYGYLYDIEGNPEDNATVAAWLPSGVSRLGSLVVSPFRKETSTTTAGYFYIDLIPSTDLTPADSKYEIAITLSNGTVLRERVLIPDQINWMLTW